MPRNKQRFEKLELRDTLALASIIGTLPRELVDESIDSTVGKARRNRTLPPGFVVYFLVFLCIFKDKSADEVLRMLFEGLDAIIKDKAVISASDAAISKARERIGKAPLQVLFRSFCKPLCKADGNGTGFYKGLRKCAIDASECYLQSTQDVLGEFPVLEKEGKNPQCCPKLKFGAVMELGSHAFLDIEAGNALHSEQDFADELIGRLGPGKLLLGDRYYRSVLNVLRVMEQNSEVLFRAPDGMKLRQIRKFSDGSYLAEIVAGRKSTGHAKKYITKEKKYSSATVRVIHYSIIDRDGKTVSSGRLITSLTDPVKYHAQDLIDIYAERWEEESGFDEMKNHLMKGAQDSLRSKKAELVWQEFWAMLISHYIIRKIIFEASGLTCLMPREHSFVGVRNVVQRKTTARLFSPSANDGAALEDCH